MLYSESVVITVDKTETNLYVMNPPSREIIKYMNEVQQGIVYCTLDFWKSAKTFILKLSQ